MDTQNTSIHLTLWHKEFWLLALANLLVSMGVYMMIPETLSYMRLIGLGSGSQALVMALYVVGLYVFGPFVNYLVERYRRKRVCLYALTLLALDMGAMSYLRTTPYMSSNVLVIGALRLVMGAAFGLAQMVLLSTLVVDSVQSYFRTEANHHVNWFGRFAVALGPLLSFYAVSHESLDWAFTLSAVLVLVALLLISVVRFPFKTPPDDVHLFGLDRFFLPAGTLLFVCLMLATSSIGLIYLLRMPSVFYAWLMVGFFLAILAERFAFINAELKSQAMTGLLAMAIAMILMITRSQLHEAMAVAAAFLGFGLGVVGSRFLLFFIKLSAHCQRGTSQSTFFLAWETGLGLGVSAGLYFFSDSPRQMLLCALAVVAIVGIFYAAFVHHWYMEHKNR